MTLVRGDAHWWELPYPQQQRPRGCQVGWEDWTVAVGAMDIAYTIAMLWFSERRRALERSLLNDYHHALVAGGVRL